MKYILLLLIRLYWHLIPDTKRRHCLFEESCSRFVYRIASTNGFLRGLSALNNRFHQCRPGYRITKNEISHAVELHLKDGSVIKDKEISGRILESIEIKSDS